MQLRWLWGDYVDPEIDIPPERLRRIHRRINANARTLPNFWLIILLMFGGGVAAVGLISEPLGDWLRDQFAVLGSNEAHGISAAAVSFPYTVVCVIILGRLYVPIARRSMCECGVRVCIDCGFDLRGAGDQDTTCPECGSHQKMIEEIGDERLLPEQKDT